MARYAEKLMDDGVKGEGGVVKDEEKSNGGGSVPR